MNLTLDAPLDPKWIVKSPNEVILYWYAPRTNPAIYYVVQYAYSPNKLANITVKDTFATLPLGKENATLRAFIRTQFNGSEPNDRNVAATDFYITHQG